MAAGHASVSESLDEKRLGGGEGVTGQGLEGGFEQGGQLGGGGRQRGALEVAAQFLPQVGVASQAALGGFFLE